MTRDFRLPGTLRDIVDTELGRLGRGPLHDVVAHWPETVGDDVARNAWPARLSRDGTLHVSTSSSVWAQELTHCEKLVLERLAGERWAADIRRIRFAVGELPEPGAESETQTKQVAPELLLEHRRIGDQLASEINDPALRERVSKAIATSVARGVGKAD